MFEGKALNELNGSSKDVPHVLKTKQHLAKQQNPRQMSTKLNLLMVAE